MSAQQSDARPARPGWRRAALVVGAVALLVAAALAGRYAAHLMWGGVPADSTTAGTKPAPPPAAEPSAQSQEQPGFVIEASREAKPRPKKAAAPAAAPVEAPAAVTTGELRIDADVPGAMVFLDRKFVGNTPVTAKDVAPGSHHLNLSADGYDGYSESIEVAAGPADVMVRFKEIRLKEAVAVVHKHTIGSCDGRLTADPQGVRYETTNAGDAFTMRFADIETFEIDYLAKNLKIKKRGGKSYNFTTKTENADPLFVFHRNVDKVRRKVTGAPPAAK